MNLRSIRTLILSSFFAAILIPGLASAQDEPQAFLGIDVQDVPIVAGVDATFDVQIAWLNGAFGNWTHTEVYFADGTLYGCFDTSPDHGANTGGVETVSIPVQGALQTPGDYDLVMFQASNSSCNNPGNTAAVALCLVGGVFNLDLCPSDVLQVYTRGTFTVTKDWQPNRGPAATATFGYVCDDGTNGTGEVLEGTPFELELQWDIDDAPPSCTITENVPSGYTETANAGECTDLQLVSQDNVTCDFVNDINPVSFLVRKDFSDDNPAEVQIELVGCDHNAEVVDTVKSTASEGSPAEFIIDNYRANGTSTCTFKEVDPGIVGYTPGICQGFVFRDTNAHPGGGGECTLVNNQDPVTVYVDKIYPEGPHPVGGNPEVDVTLVCNAALVDGVAGSNTATTVDGRASFVVSEFLFDGSNCYATEVAPAGYVRAAIAPEDGRDCGADAANPGFAVYPGGAQEPKPDVPVGEEEPAPQATCAISNIPTEATFTVQKDFSDDNPMLVDVTAVCSDNGAGPGLSLNGLFAGDAGFGEGTSGIGNSFAVVVKYADGSASCQASEEDIPGYSTLAGNCDAGQTVPVDSTDVACEFFNDQDPIEIQASKAYSNGGGVAVDFAVACTDVGSVSPSTDEASPGNPATFIVNDVKYDGSSKCSVSEPVPPGGYYETGNTCTVDGIDLTPDSDDPRTCEITNSPTRATFKVTKFFADGNNIDEIEVSIDCNTGLILDQDKDLGHNGSVEFVVTSFDEGTLNCTITEDGLAGYAGEYTAIGDPNVVNDISCEYLAVGGGDAYECEIVNTPLPVTVNVYKDWVFEGTTAPDIDTYIEVWMWCTSEVVSADCGAVGPASDSPVDSPAGGAGYEWWGACHWDFGQNDIGVVFEVVPDFPQTSCYIYENTYDNAIEQSNGCGEFNLKANQGFDCVITNTVFFEGIPTLSQYGMALLALLMLGVGFVSFRRFV